MNDSMIIAELKNLPKPADVVASSMIYAQGYTLTTEERALIIARADLFEALGLHRRVTVTVRNFAGAVIGRIAYNI
ncbi:hypothetical protein ACFVVM_32495 [Nocardia sp. NPDC058176]|uniref:hypothetical protein n=1 Tax=Nocardia sp. NPDC058176 TaxID=3346368 RepID=UPI0036DD07D1